MPAYLGRIGSQADMSDCRKAAAWVVKGEIECNEEHCFGMTMLMSIKNMQFTTTLSITSSILIVYSSV